MNSELGIGRRRWDGTETFNNMPVKSVSNEFTESHGIDFFAQPDVISEIVNPVADRMHDAWEMGMGMTVSVLETGTGNGILIRCLKNRLDQFDKQASYKFYGTDKLSFRIQENQKLYPGINWQTMDNKKLLFMDLSVSNVFMRNTLHLENSIENQKQVLSEAERVLTVDGYFTNQAFAFQTDDEVELQKEIYNFEYGLMSKNFKSSVPNEIRPNTVDELQKMHKDVFGNAKVLKNDYSARKMANQATYQAAYELNEKQLNKLRGIILAVPEDRRPNFWVSGKDIVILSPNLIIQSKKLDGNSI